MPAGGPLLGGCGRSPVPQEAVPVSPFDLETDLHRHLESIYLAVLDGASEGDNFEPLHMFHSLASFGDGVSRGFGKALLRLTNDFDTFPNQTLSPPETAHNLSHPLFVFAHEGLVGTSELTHDPGEGEGKGTIF